MNELELNDGEVRGRLVDGIFYPDGRESSERYNFVCVVKDWGEDLYSISEMAKIVRPPLDEGEHEVYIRMGRIAPYITPYIKKADD